MITALFKAKTALAKITGLGTNVSTFLATPSSANLASALTDETGSGLAVFATSPTLSGATIKNMVEEVLTTGGTTTAYTLTPSVAIGSYVTGHRFLVKFNATCGASPTINISGLGAKNLTKGGATALSASDVLINGIYIIEYDGTQFQVIGISAAASSMTAATRAEVATGTSNTLMLTPQNQHEFNVPPQGFLYNGKIVPSVASNNLTVALKGLDGNDPSATNPVYVRIGDTVRSITAALSVTKNAGTNWCNAGGSELAAKEIDYFVYLGYNATDGVVIGFSRINHGTRYDSFSATSTSETYCAISTITTAAAADYYEVIGRFAATLSAGAGYTWTVPTFTATNLIQRPIYETRWLTITPVYGGFSADPSGGNMRYKITQRSVHIYKDVIGASGTSNATTFTIVLPLASAATYLTTGPMFVADNSANQSVIGHYLISASSNSWQIFKTWYSTAFTSSGTKNAWGTAIYEI